MPSHISRKQFLTGLAAVTLGVACGSDSDDDGGGTGGSGTGGSGTGGSGTGGSGGSGTGGSGATGGSSTGGSSGSGTGGAGAVGGASGGAAGGGGTANACTGMISAVIFDNHDHELDIPLADIEAGVEKTYETTGSANHCHTVVLTAADFATLKSGGVVTKTSCTGTNHQYALSCGAPPVPSEPDCNGTPNLGACN